MLMTSLLLFLLLITATHPSLVSGFSNRNLDVAQALERIENALDDPRPAIQNLETTVGLLPANDDAPNRTPGYRGTWYVWYTDCPPPSNGQLGPFKGTSEQYIAAADEADGQRHAYQNILRVPPNDWLVATLDGVWEEWDGSYLDDDNSKKDDNNDNTAADAESSPDWGATHWKVTFLQLQIQVLGIPLFAQRFPPDTARIWRTSYLDADTRIVHAGRTGRSADESVFYTKRTPRP